MCIQYYFVNKRLLFYLLWYIFTLIKFQIIKVQRHVMYHRKVTASISKQISRFSSGLKTLYVKVRWLYYNHFIFFIISTFTYGFMVAAPMNVKFQWFPVIVFKSQCSTILNIINIAEHTKITNSST